jgi:hypothetical protein
MLLVFGLYLLACEILANFMPIISDSANLIDLEFLIFDTKNLSVQKVYSH